MKPRLSSLGETGFSLMEAILVIGVSTMLVGIFAVISTALSKSFVETQGQSDIASYRMELKRKLRSLQRLPSGINSRSECMALLGPGGPRALTQNQLSGILSNMVKDTSSANASLSQQKQFSVELEKTNLLSANGDYVNRFGDLWVARTYFNSFILFSESEAFRIPTPMVIDLITPNKPISTLITYIVQGELHVELSKENFTDRTPIKPLRINMAIEKATDGTTSLKDCGVRSLSEIVAHLEICKALGPDFKFVYDNFDGQGGGQCYAPMYDPTRQSPAFTDADYQAGRVASITDYMPIKGFFCRFAMAGKGYDFPFCTGVN